MDDRMTGVVKFFNSTKGYGFIKPDNGGKDIFVHISALERAGISAVNEGDKLSFILEEDRRGRGQKAGQIEFI
ncbi:MAG: cold-shock protein [Pseudomonadota bacterium]